VSCRCPHCRCCSPRFSEEPEIGTVLAFRHTFPDETKVYGYAALRAQNGRWYLTTSSAHYEHTSPMTWGALRAFIGEGACSKALTWEDIP
jgi:hypothetical protein